MGVAYTFTGDPAPVNVFAPDGALLAPQRFWGAMQSQGAPSVQGDAYMTGYATRKSPVNARYDPQKYYNYGVDIHGPAGRSGSSIPASATPHRSPSAASPPTRAPVSPGPGAGSNTGGNGANPVHPVSAQYNLYDTHDTPYDTADDTLVATSGTAFRQSNLTDLNLAGNTGAAYSNPTDCSAVAWHNHWWPLPGAQNLAPGTYRLNTTSRIYSAAIGSHPAGAVLDGPTIRRTRPGSMPSPSGRRTAAPLLLASTASAPWRHISRSPARTHRPCSTWRRSTPVTPASGWTSTCGILATPAALTADLAFLAPNGGAGAVTSFYYNSSAGTVKPSNFSCGPSTSSLVSSIRTSAGAGGIYNG